MSLSKIDQIETRLDLFVQFSSKKLESLLAVLPRTNLARCKLVSDNPSGLETGSS